MEQFEQNRDEETCPYSVRLAAAMLTCSLLSSSGCTARRYLCNDEFGLMASCPGQMMRWVNRKDMIDE